MTIPVTPQVPNQPESTAGDRGRPWTVAAFLTQLAYLAWLPAMFAFGYLLGDIFDYEPGTDADIGVAATVVSVLVALLVVPLPSWAGVGLALKARRLGARTAATVALIVCALTGLFLAVLSLPFNLG